MSESIIYFIERQSDKAIKIGTTKNLQQRMIELRGQHGGLSLLGIIDGGRIREKLLHWIFNGNRVDGEFFMPDDELMAIIRSETRMPTKIKKTRTDFGKSIKSSFNNKRLGEAINKSGLSMNEVDRRLNLHVGLTSKYVRGVRSPSPEQLCRFLVAIGWTDDQLRQERLVDWYSINGN